MTRIALALACVLLLVAPAAAAGRCDDEQPTPQLPSDLALCAKLEAIVRKPSALPADQYQVELNRFLGAMCHRNRDAGWKTDKGPVLHREGPRPRSARLSRGQPQPQQHAGRGLEA